MVLAYLDPAAGGMVIQTIVAFAVALPFILRAQIARGIARIRGRVPRKPNDSPAED